MDLQGVEDFEQPPEVDAAYAFQYERVLVAVTFDMTAARCWQRERRRKDLRVVLEMVARDLEEAVLDLRYIGLVAELWDCEQSSP